MFGGRFEGIKTVFLLSSTELIKEIIKENGDANTTEQNPYQIKGSFDRLRVKLWNHLVLSY